jgi:WXXGXW repeat (2 copies)
MQILKVRRLVNFFGVEKWALLAASLLFIVAMMPAAAPAQIALSVSIAPPVLPVYTQPICPGERYIWTPGYWSYTEDGGYYWVPGTWVEAPEVGLLWTPGYWGWGNGVYLWNAGYWGPEVGFYGGIDYGYGYIGNGYAGGYWNGGRFFYNSQVNNINTTIIHNVYRKTVVEHATRVSYNGGRGGIKARPTAKQEAFAHERHVPPAPVQREHETAARADRSQFASVNHGRPAVLATPKPGAFKGEGVVGAKGAAPSRESGRKTAAAPGGRSHTAAAAHEGSTARTNKPAARESKPAAKARTETAPRTETKSRTTSHTTTNARTDRPATHESKPAARSRTESAPRTETKPRAETAPRTTRTEKPATHESKPAAQPQSHTHAAPAPRTESKPRAEAKPAPAPRAESRPAPAAHESRPAPAAHESRPAPAQHAAPPPAHESKTPAQHEAPQKEKKPPRN